MNRIRSLVTRVLILAGCGTLAFNLHAQTESAVTVSVPIPFTVGTRSIAPGTYQFSLVSSSFLLSVRDVKTGNREMFMVRPEKEHSTPVRGRLIFQNCDVHCALDQIHFPGGDTFTQLIQPRGADRLEAKKSSPGASISVAQRDRSVSGRQGISPTSTDVNVHSAH